MYRIQINHFVLLIQINSGFDRSSFSSFFQMTIFVCYFEVKASVSLISIQRGSTLDLRNVLNVEFDKTCSKKNKDKVCKFLTCSWWQNKNSLFFKMLWTVRVKKKTFNWSANPLSHTISMSSLSGQKAY